MPTGDWYSASGKDSHRIEFFLSNAGADTKTTLTTTVETAFALGWIGTGVTNFLSRWSAPWPCVVSEVFAEGQLLANTDAMQVGLYRNAVADYTVNAVIIRNAVGGAASNYVRITATAANQYQRARYGVNKAGAILLNDTSVSPNFTTDAATTFDKDDYILAAGDRLRATYKMLAAGDSASHVRCTVTVVRVD